MRKYIFKRLLMALGIVLFVILLNYVIIHLAPGDPVRIMAGFDNPSQEQMDALTQKYGLDQPLYVQFWKYISALFRGDMGISYQYNEPVAQLILERVGASLLLSGTAAVLAVVCWAFMRAATTERRWIAPFPVWLIPLTPCPPSGWA